jgi:hypothetical protein
MPSSPSSYHSIVSYHTITAQPSPAYLSPAVGLFIMSSVKPRPVRILRARNSDVGTPAEQCSIGQGRGQDEVG